jgi:hypothetical protein
VPSRPRTSRFRRTLLVLLTVAVAVAAGFWLTTRADDDGGGGTTAGDTTPVAAPTTGSPASGGDPVATLEPERTGGSPIPTEPAPEDVATDSPAPAPDPGAEVSPQLTYYGWVADIEAVEAGGIVLGIVESGGTCTLTLRQGSNEVDVSAEAVDNVTSTSCPAMTVPGDRLQPGTWTATLSYDSDTSRGAGDAVEVDVP